MKRLCVALFVLIVVFVAQIGAQSTQFGESPQKQIAAQYKGEWKVVVGAKGIRPIISINGGKTRSLSPSSVLSFPRKDKVLPVAGEIKLAEKEVLTPYPYPRNNVKSVVLKFIPENDFGNLYIGLFLMNIDSQLIGIRVKEIGNVVAGKSYNVSYEYIFKQHEKAPVVRFYSKGLEVRVNE